MSHGRAATGQTADEKKEEKKDEGRARIDDLKPFYGYPKNLNPECFRKVVIDPFSLKLLQIALQNEMTGQRFAVVGFIVGDRVYMHFRPTLPSTAKEEEIRAARELFTDIVIAKRDTLGIVHALTIEQVQKRYPEYNSEGGDPRFSQAYRVGLSVLKGKGNTWLWLNRSMQNHPTFTRQPLAQACHAMYLDPKKLALLATSLADDMGRSLPRQPFDDLVRASTVLLSTPEEKAEAIPDPDCRSFAAEAAWEEIRSCESHDERLARIQESLLENLDCIASMKPDPKWKQATSQFEKEFEMVLREAKAHAIPLDLDTALSSGMPLLCKAAANGYLKICELLLANGARKGARDQKGRTALMHAARNKQWPVVKFFYEKAGLGKEEQEAAASSLLACAESMIRSLPALSSHAIDPEAADSLLENLRDLESYSHGPLWPRGRVLNWSLGDILEEIAKKGHLPLVRFFYEKESSAINKIHAIRLLLDDAERHRHKPQFEEVLGLFREEKHDKNEMLKHAVQSESRAFFNFILPRLMTASRTELNAMARLGGALMCTAIVRYSLSTPPNNEIVEGLLEMERAFKTRAVDPIDLGWSVGEDDKQNTPFILAFRIRQYDYADRFYNPSSAQINKHLVELARFLQASTGLDVEQRRFFEKIMEKTPSSALDQSGLLQQAALSKVEWSPGVQSLLARYKKSGLGAAANPLVKTLFKEEEKSSSSTKTTNPLSFKPRNIL